MEHETLAQPILSWLIAAISRGLIPHMTRLSYLFYWPLLLSLVNYVNPGRPRQLAQITVSLILLYILDLQMFAIGIIIMSFITWATILNVQGLAMPWVVAILSTAHLILISYSRDYGLLSQPQNLRAISIFPLGSWTFSALKSYLSGSAFAPMSSTACMWSITKFQSAAWFFYDNRSSSQQTKKVVSLPYQHMYPTYIDILCYALWTPTLFTPAFTYHQYLLWCHELVYKRFALLYWHDLRIQLAIKARQIIFCLLIHLSLSAVLPEPGEVLVSDTKVNWLKQILFVYLCCLNLRMLRYVWWGLWEFGCVFSGVGIEEQGNSELNYSAIQNADIIKFEFGFDGQVWRSWNMRMQSWLHSQLYRRLGPRDKRARPFRVLLTFFLCGVWHGVKLDDITWGVVSGVTRIILTFMETSTASLIKGLNLGRSRFFIYAIEWILTQGLVVLLNFQWLGYSRIEYLAVWDLFSWVVPALSIWVAGLASITTFS